MIRLKDWQDKKQFKPAFDKQVIPKQKRTEHEYEECKVLKQWMDKKKLRYHHIANERQITNKQELYNLMKLKAIGMTKGFPDYIVFAGLHILFIEMKRADHKGVVGEEQKEWIEYLNGYNASSFSAICRGADEAIKYISEYL